MATTAGTTGPIVPYSGFGSGGKSGSNIVSLAVADSQTIAIGDILTYASGVCTSNNAAAALIAGVAVSAITTTTATDADRVEVALALPGSLFIATMTSTDADTDLTDPAYADLTQGASGKDFAEHADGYPVIIDAHANDTAYVVAFAREQFKGANFVAGASGTINPRVVFQFNMGETIFEPTSA